jgi:hypothetical protein
MLSRDEKDGFYRQYADECSYVLSTLKSDGTAGSRFQSFCVEEFHSTCNIRLKPGESVPVRITFELVGE